MKFSVAHSNQIKQLELIISEILQVYLVCIIEYWFKNSVTDWLEIDINKIKLNFNNINFE